MVVGRFEGKVAVVTGASSGIGRATARLFAGEGASVVVADVNVAGGEETVAQIAAAGGEGTFVATDVTDEAAVEALVRATIERYGRLDCAHNNAGINSQPTLLADSGVEAWDRMIATNLTSVFLCMKHELRVMSEQGSGAIVNTSSGAGVFGSVRTSAYTAAKHGVIGLTRAAALEYADVGVRVNAVCPGLTDTPMFRSTKGRDAEQTARNLAFSKGRVNAPEQIGETVLWLCSDEATDVNGQALLVDGRYGAERRLATRQRWAPLEDLLAEA